MKSIAPETFGNFNSPSKSSIKATIKQESGHESRVRSFLALEKSPEQEGLKLNRIASVIARSQRVRPFGPPDGSQ